MKDKLRELADRLDVLAHAVTEANWREFSMRVPVEPERDADCVLSQAAIELRSYAAILDASDTHPHTPDAADSGRVGDEFKFTDEDIRLALDYSRNYATARPDISPTAKEHVSGLCDRLESLLADRAALAAQGQGDVPHPDDIAVDAFATAMKAKLAEARAKGRGGWQDKNDCTQHRLSNMLRDHVEKGDPRDVANFCMFLHQRGEAILPNDSGRNVVCQLAFGERGRDPRDGPRVISWNEMPSGTYQLCLATAPPASPAGVPDAKAMAYRFMGWRLPDDFRPDCGISFDPESLKSWPGMWPTGTNLFHVGQAEQMFRYVLATPSAPEGGEVE